MFDVLSDRLERIAGRLRSRGRLSDADLDEALAEIRTALLEADVEVGVVRAFVESVRSRCSGEALSKSLSPGQQVVKAVHEELIEVLGSSTLKLTYASRPPTVVLLAGLQGSGKTTAAAKLARWWKQQGRNPMLVGADLQRPAAVEQLRVLGERAGVSVFSEPTDPVAVARAGLEEARRLGRDVCIIDTAGRLSIDEALMDEVRRISAATEPHYTFLVVDAMTGQDAVQTASAFHASLALDGIILTKLDSDARGGAALSVKHVVGRPIAFSSTGEGLADLDLFHPDRMADRILGMGDVLTLIEQAEASMDADVVSKAAGRMLEGRFTLEDFLEQLQQVKRLGSLGGMMRLLPGMSKEMRQAANQIDDHEIARVEGIVRSMTPAERADPALIDGSRRVRIAHGCGRSPQDVNQLLKQFREMQKMMRGMGANMANVPGASGKGMGRLGALMGARKSMGDLKAAMPAGTDMASLMGTAPARQDFGLGAGAPPRPATPRPSGAARQPGKKKKKGGRVTPPKGR
jgi:signal recognition particle subunit SRP54